ncbi:MAG: hypothetical protein Q7S29_06335 [Candidatus Peribacter sp.]|nr:hypothetical protein [Candidatus Peribacter sp.]
MHKELPDEPKTATETGHPADNAVHLENRREFLEHAMAGTAAAALATSLPHDMASAQQHHDAHAEHGHHPDMQKMLAEERKHPFHADPAKYLEEHPEIERNAFHSTDTRILRTAGSGILKDPDQWAQHIAAYVRQLQQENGDGADIAVILEAHDTCGAGALKRPGQEKTDDLAHADIEAVAEKLRAMGIKATCPKQRSRMNGLPVHNALGVTIDMTRGSRMQCPPFNSFTLSSPDMAAMPSEGRTAGQISSKPLEQHGHGYGTLLKESQAPYTYLVYVDADQREQSAPKVADIRKEADGLRQSAGMNTRMIERVAPVETQHVPVRKVVVRCMDERCNADAEEEK